MRQDAAGTEDERVAINANTAKSEGVKTLNISSNERLRILKVVDCNLAKLDLGNITKLEEIDVRLNHLNKLDLSNSYKLEIEDIKAGWQRTKNGSRQAHNVYVFNIPGGISETTVTDANSPNYYVKFTKMSSKEDVAGKLDNVFGSVGCNENYLLGGSTARAVLNEHGERAVAGYVNEDSG